MPTLQTILRPMVDLTPIERLCDEIKSLALEAGDIPESMLEQLRRLPDEIGDELLLSGPVPTTRTGELVIEVGIRKGGRIDACIAALRALRDGRGGVHGGSL